MLTPPRMAAVWCPDWPVTTARTAGGLSGDEPVAVLTANRVIACSTGARHYGVTRGLRRREAQGRCPELVLLARDEAAEARAFEPILAAIESIAPGVEVTRPGLAAIGITGPTRYFGGETAVLHALSRAIGAHTDDVLIGVADGAFAAEQAARRGTVVPAGASPEFLSPLPVQTLDEPELVDLLRRMGIRTLGAFAGLPGADVAARFGPAGTWAHRQSGGLDSRPIAGRRPATEFETSISLEPPLDTVDTIAFTARTAIEDFIAKLAAHGLACTCVELSAQTDRGEETLRRWRHTGVLTAADITDRVRWQLDGWLHQQIPTGPIFQLRVSAIDTVPIGTQQKGLWGSDGADDVRAHRALARIQTLLGHGSVATPVLAGGRSPAHRTELITWGDDRPATPARPWPGRLPAPAPSIVIDPPLPVQVLDETGRPVLITERGVIPSPPARFTPGQAGTEPSNTITAWAGPWPVDERWWTTGQHQPTARLQLVDTTGQAYLVCYHLNDKHWVLEALYD